MCGSGVSVEIRGEGKLGYALPALSFDGEISPKVVAEEHSLTVFYEGWSCRYTTNGRISEEKGIAANRNGHYRRFLAFAENTLNVKIEIIKESVE